MAGIRIMVNGLPGNMAHLFAARAEEDGRFELVRHALTGPEITMDEHRLPSGPVRLIRPDEREGFIDGIIDAHGPFISVDYSHPAAVNANVDFYCKHHLPFVMGTTGGDRDLLEQVVRAGDVPAVIAPNMGKQIVGFQAMMAFGADNFPDLFKGYSLEVRESHQNGKADTSGTAKAIVGYFNRLGLDFDENQIQKVRDPETQKTELNIPEEFLTGHGWHTYTLVSPDKTVKFEFTHNVNGREIYAGGTMDAVVFLDEKIRQGAGGTVFNMIDVLKTG